MPSHRMNSGSSAIFGIGNNAATAGRPTARGSDQMPMAMPSAEPRRGADRPAHDDAEQRVG